MNKETLSFKIKLGSTHWDKLPAYTISVDNDLVSEGQCNNESIIDFDHELSDGEHELRIQLVNKTNKDCVQNEEKTEILRDMQLHIQEIYIDNIDLGHIKHGCSEFIPDDKNQHETLKACVDLGWNGTYVLKFTSPFYIWLLENM